MVLAANRIRRGYVDTSGGQVHYREAGPADGFPMVLLHQTASSSSMFEWVMAELLEQYRMIAPDTPGFGESFRPESKGSIELYAHALYEALQGLGITECWLFGVHSGASIAVQMVHDHPALARKLVLSGPPYANDSMKTLIAEQGKPFKIGADGHHLNEIWQRVRDKDPDAPLWWSHLETVNNLHAGSRWYEAYVAIPEQPFNEQLAALSCPTLLMAGEFDSLRDSLEPAHAALPGSQMRVVPGATTYICVREAPAVAAILREFFC